MRSSNIWWDELSVWQGGDWFCWHSAIKIRRKLFYRYVLQSENASGKSYGALPVNYDEKDGEIHFHPGLNFPSGIRFHIIQYPPDNSKEMLHRCTIAPVAKL